MSDDSLFMARALTLAERGWGRVHPNPMVGAVVVKEGRIIGEGWHAEFGGPHAEVAALRAAGEAARGATLYVTLEPCAHHGKTPPCTDVILAAGIARVVYAVDDPHREAAGGGALLAGRGVEVVTGVARAEAIGADPAFHWAHRSRLPFVALKLASSLDGRLSREPGRPTAVTGPEANAVTHLLRAGFDAIMVGRGTVEADDPLLTVRGAIEPRTPPIRIVVDSAARTPPGARMLREASDAPVLVVTADTAPRDRVEALCAAGARVMAVPPSPDGVDMQAALSALRNDNVRSIFCEGGGTLAASLLAADAVGRIHLFLAPVFFGPPGSPAFPLRAAIGGWTLRSSGKVGRDALLVLDRSAEED